MAIFLTLLFIIAAYLRPGDLSPQLAALRLPFWLGNVGMVTSGVGTLMKGRTSVWRSPQLYFLIAFTLVLTLSPIIDRHWAGGAAIAFTEFSTAAIGYVLIVFSVDSIGKLRVLTVLMICLSITLVVEGALAYHYDMWAEQFIFTQVVGADVDGNQIILRRVRSLGNLNDPNDLAQALIAASPLLWPFWRAGRKFHNFCLVVLPSCVLLYGVFLTRSRGAATSILVIAMLFCYEKLTRFRKTATVVIPLVMALGFSVVGLSGGRDISSGDESAAGRLDAWHAGFEMLKNNPLFGVGYNAFTEFNELTAHNSFVLCLAELGFIGYSLWLGLLIISIWELRSVEKWAANDPDGTDLVRWAAAVRFCLVAFLSGAFFLSRTYAPILYMILALGFVVVDVARRKGFASPATTGAVIMRAGALSLASVAGLYLVLGVGSLWMH